MNMNNAEINIRPDYDRLINDIADYVMDYKLVRMKRLILPGIV